MLGDEEVRRVARRRHHDVGRVVDDADERVPVREVSNEGRVVTPRRPLDGGSVVVDVADRSVGRQTSGKESTDLTPADDDDVS